MIHKFNSWQRYPKNKGKSIDEYVATLNPRTASIASGFVKPTEDEPEITGGSNADLPVVTSTCPKQDHPVPQPASTTLLASPPASNATSLLATLPSTADPIVTVQEPDSKYSDVVNVAYGITDEDTRLMCLSALRTVQPWYNYKESLASSTVTLNNASLNINVAPNSSFYFHQSQNVQQNVTITPPVIPRLTVSPQQWQQGQASQIFLPKEDRKRFKLITRFVDRAYEEQEQEQQIAEEKAKSKPKRTRRTNTDESTDALERSYDQMGQLLSDVNFDPLVPGPSWTQDVLNAYFRLNAHDPRSWPVPKSIDTVKFSRVLDKVLYRHTWSDTVATWHPWHIARNFLDSCFQGWTKNMEDYLPLQSKPDTEYAIQDIVQDFAPDKQCGLNFTARPKNVPIPEKNKEQDVQQAQEHIDNVTVRLLNRTFSSNSKIFKFQ